MRVVPLLLAALCGSPTTRAADFETIARSAERLEALEPFLARYVGRCTDVYERRVCEANVIQARHAAEGKTFSVRIPDAASLVRPQLNGGGFLLLVTPFVDGGGLALTHGAPTKQDVAGNPLIGLIPIRGDLPPGMMDMEFQSPFRTGAIELEIVFRPERIWKLKRPGESGRLEGVAARFLAIRVIDARTGSEIATKVL
jgi:hypothetical protein